MNTFNNSEEIDKIHYQIEQAGVQKRKLIQKIYREYELYLHNVRNLLLLSVEKEFNDLCGYTSFKENFLNEEELLCLFDKKISNLIFTKLPFLTVEQLKIKKIDKNIKEGDTIEILGEVEV